MKKTKIIVSIIISIAACFIADIRNVSPQLATARSFRASRMLFLPSAFRQISLNPAYQAHVAKIDKNDAFFYVAHRHYLAKGLTAKQRITIAQNHYQHETESFDKSYATQVYQQDGLVLWKVEAEESIFDIRLMPANDVLYEGGCSLVFHVDGARICVVSYVNVHNDTFMLAQLENEPTKTVFVTRKQSTADHEYQKKFNKVFDRTTAAHMCYGALNGLAMAQGYNQLLAISAEAHPSMKSGLEKILDAAYDQFWLSLGGKKTSPFGYVVDVPMHMSPLDDMDAKTRKRAIARRQHIHQVMVDSYHVVRQHLVSPLPEINIPFEPQNQQCNEPEVIKV